MNNMYITMQTSYARKSLGTKKRNSLSKKVPN